jgi:hypothetical protein
MLSLLYRDTTPIHHSDKLMPYVQKKQRPRHPNRARKHT